MADDPPGAPILGYYIQGGPVLVDTDSDPVVATTFVKPTTLQANSFTNLVTVDGISPKRDVLYFVEAATDLALTTSVLNRLDDFAPGRPGNFDPDTGANDVDDNVDGDGDPITDDDDTDNVITHWGIRVMAVNRVVQRHAENGIIDADPGDEANDQEGNWTNIPGRPRGGRRARRR
jgi:hypothetical protein